MSIDSFSDNMKVRHAIECARQWGRWMVRMDDITKASDSVVIEVVDSEHLAKAGFLDGIIKPASRAEWIATRDILGLKRFPMDQGELC